MSFIAPSEDAFLPDHTICDGTNAYVRSPETIGLLLDPTTNLLAGLRDLGRNTQELFHPNVDGYRALTRAIIRWSLTDDADRALAPQGRGSTAVRAVPAVSDEPVETLSTDSTDTPRIMPGSTYAVTADGFAPQLDVQITLESEPRVLTTARADADGNITADVVIPSDAPAGDHDLVLRGIDADANGRELRLPVSISGTSPVPLGLVAPLLMAALIAIGLTLTRPEISRRKRASQPQQGGVPSAV